MLIEIKSSTHDAGDACAESQQSVKRRESKRILILKKSSIRKTNLENVLLVMKGFGVGVAFVSELGEHPDVNGEGLRP